VGGPAAPRTFETVIEVPREVPVPYRVEVPVPYEVVRHVIVPDQAAVGVGVGVSGGGISEAGETQIRAKGVEFAIPNQSFQIQSIAL